MRKSLIQLFSLQDLLLHNAHFTQCLSQMFLLHVKHLQTGWHSWHSKELQLEHETDESIMFFDLFEQLLHKCFKMEFTWEMSSFTFSVHAFFEFSVHTTLNSFLLAIGRSLCFIIRDSLLLSILFPVVLSVLELIITNLEDFGDIKAISSSEYFSMFVDSLDCSDGSEPVVGFKIFWCSSWLDSDWNDLHSSITCLSFVMLSHINFRSWTYSNKNITITEWFHLFIHFIPNLSYRFAYIK